MAERAELLADYQRLRRALRTLSTALMGRLPEGVLGECGKKLRLTSKIRGRKRDIFVFDNEYEMSVLMDYCIYHARRGGRTVIERSLAESPPPPASDEETLLRAMQEVRFSLFAVEGMEPGMGVQTRDLLRDEPVFLVDIGFSRTTSAGIVLAGNVVSPAGLSMTTGAMLPVDGLIIEDLVEQLQQRFGATTVAQFRQLSPVRQSELATLVIRSCLAGGAASYVTAEDVKVEPERHPRNSPCPCGSGKKYKRCCGRA